jgi:hypothetical protein
LIPVAESFIITNYEYEKPYSYRNYESRALIEGDQRVSIWVPENGKLTILAEVGEFKSEGKTITYEDFFNNLAPRSDQGELVLMLPATNEEIVQAMEEEKIDKEIAGLDVPAEGDDTSKTLTILLIAFVFLVLIIVYYKRRSSRN